MVEAAAVLASGEAGRAKAAGPVAYSSLAHAAMAAEAKVMEVVVVVGA